jgi:hypothetical protein
MSAILYPPKDIRCLWFNIDNCTEEQAIPQLINYYLTAKVKSVDMVKIECMLHRSIEKVVIIIRENFRGLFSEELQKDGLITFQSTLGKKTKYHIKVKASTSKQAYPLILPLMIALKQKKLIKHSQVCISETNGEQGRVIMSLNFKWDGRKDALSEVHLNRLAAGLKV